MVSSMPHFVASCKMTNRRTTGTAASVLAELYRGPSIATLFFRTRFMVFLRPCVAPMWESSVGMVLSHSMRKSGTPPRSLLRRAARQREKTAVCFWAVMSPEIAAQIQRELACDRRAEAFLLLESLAYELGRILPDSVDPVAAHLE